MPGFLAVALALALAWALLRRSASHIVGQPATVAQHAGRTESAFLPAPQLPRAAIARRTYQTIFCRSARYGTLKGLAAAGFKRTSEQKEGEPTGILLASADVVVQCNAAPETIARLDSRLNGTRLCSSILGLFSTLCIGGSKFTQLKCRRSLANEHGCVFEHLGIQPAQFKLDDEADCQALFASKHLGNSSSNAFILKPSAGQAGHGIRYFKNLGDLSRAVGSCESSSSSLRKGMMAQFYVVPALVSGGYKFDVRNWLLVASVEPLILFSALGIVRVASVPFEAASQSKLVHVTNAQGQEGSGHHIKSFKWLEDELKQPGFSQGQFRDEADRAMLYVAQAHFSQPKSAESPSGKAHYQVFGCDFIIDSSLRAHLLECNGNSFEQGPQVLWEEMMALVLNLHIEPQRLLDPTLDPQVKREGVWRSGPARKKPPTSSNRLSRGYEFGSWRLLWSDLEAPLRSRNACTT